MRQTSAGGTWKRGGDATMLLMFNAAGNNFLPLLEHARLLPKRDAIAAMRVANGMEFARPKETVDRETR
jgi:hypothetical protein